MISKKEFAVHLNEILDVKGSFIGIFLSLVLILEGLGFYFSFGFENWYTHLYYHVLNLLIVVFLSFFGAITFMVWNAKANFHNLFTYSFDQLIVYLSNEIGKSAQVNLSKATNRFIKEMAAPAIAAVLAIYLPIIGGFIVGWLTVQINSVFEVILPKKGEEVPNENSGGPSYQEYVSGLEKKKIKLIEKSQAVLSILLIPLSIVLGICIIVFAIWNLLVFS